MLLSRFLCLLALLELLFRDARLLDEERLDLVCQTRRVREVFDEPDRLDSDDFLSRFALEPHDAVLTDDDLAARRFLDHADHAALGADDPRDLMRTHADNATTSKLFETRTLARHVDEVLARHLNDLCDDVIVEIEILREISAFRDEVEGRVLDLQDRAVRAVHIEPPTAHKDVNHLTDDDVILLRQIDPCERDALEDLAVHFDETELVRPDLVAEPIRTRGRQEFHALREDLAGHDDVFVLYQ